MKASSVRNQPNFGLSCYLECLTLKMRLKVILCEGTKLIAMRIESNNICSIFGNINISGYVIIYAFEFRIFQSLLKLLTLMYAYYVLEL